MAKYSEEDVVHILRRRGVKFGKKEADASNIGIVGINTLGKLDYLMNKHRYTVYLPPVSRGKGLAHP